MELEDIRDLSGQPGSHMVFALGSKHSTCLPLAASFPGLWQGGHNCTLDHLRTGISQLVPLLANAPVTGGTSAPLCQ
jgi:hypothetical protein